MKKKIYIVPIILIFIFVLFSIQLKIQAASQTPAQLYFKIFYQNSKSEDETLKALEKCTDDELKNLRDCNEYYKGKADKGKAEIQTAMKEYDSKHPEGGKFDYERWEEVKNALDIVATSYSSSINRILTERKTGAGVGTQDDEKANEIANQIKNAYNDVKENIKEADLEKLEEIDELMAELYKTDSGVKDIYENSEIATIRKTITEEIKRRDDKAQTSVDQIQESATEVEKEREKRTGGKPRDEIASYTPDEKTSPDEIIDEGSDFVQTGKDNQGAVTIDGDKLKNGSNMLFNVAFATGVVVASVIGGYLGIKFILSGAEEKANIKETLLPYFMGVIIMFSSFSIWKLVLVLLENIDKI